MDGKNGDGSDVDPADAERDPLERAFDALRDPVRRHILAKLVGGSAPTDGRAIVESIDDGSRDVPEIRIELLHVQLPKLDRLGYIEWVPGDAVRRGPRFEEIEPVIELLVGHEDALPARW